MSNGPADGVETLGRWAHHYLCGTQEADMVAEWCREGFRHNREQGSRLLRNPRARQIVNHQRLLQAEVVRWHR